MLNPLKTRTRENPGNDKLTISPWLVLAGILLGTVLGTLGNSMVSVAVAPMISDFSQPLSSVVYAVTLYTLSIAVFMPVFGSLGGITGYKRNYLFGITVFTVFSLVAAVTRSFPIFLVSRVFQGLGASSVLPAVMIFIAGLFPPEKRGRAVGFWALANGAGHALGPPLSGFLVQNFGWRSLFYMLVPLAVVCLYVVWKFLPADKVRTRKGLDAAGAAALSVAAYTFMLSLNLTARGQLQQPVTIVLWVVMAAALVFFFWHERRTSEPFVDLSLFSNLRYSAAIVVVSTDSLSLFGLLLIMPVTLIQELHVEIQWSGVIVLFLTLVMALLGPIAGHLADRFGPRRICICGLGLLAAGCGLILILHTRLVDNIPIVGIAACLAVCGAGLGLVQSPSTTAVIQVVAPDQVGIATGIFHMVRFLMGSIGSMIFGLILDLDVGGIGAGFNRSLIIMILISLVAGFISLKLPGRAGRIGS